MVEHQDFVELCAFYASGDISDDQVKRLHDHLEVCAHCRRVLEEFENVASMGLASLAPEFATADVETDRSKLEERAEQRVFARTTGEILSRRQRGWNLGRGIAHQEYPQGLELVPSEATPAAQRSFAWKPAQAVLTFVRPVRAFLPFAAAVLLAASMSLYSYRLGVQRVTSASESKLRQVQAKADSLQKEISQLSNDREALSATLQQLSNDRGALSSKLQQSNRSMETLAAEVKLRLNEIAALKQQQHQFADAARGAEAGRIASESERTAVNRKLSEAQLALDTMQKHLEAARDERAADLAEMASLEKRLADVSPGLKERDQTIQQQRDLLAYDRDIRDLIGARDLYVAEVNDVGKNAETQTPFGRIFFTKGKSLIFYAYDLDKQPGLRRASTFQAWGRSGPDFQQALPLGILYLDGSSNRRWVLKFDDPKTIAKIDAVFVTVEPKGGSQKPSGKPLLFAYLKVEPNHP